MTVTTTNSTASFTGDGVTTVFPFTFNLQLSTDLVVSVAGSVVSSSLYTVAINPTTVGGGVTFLTAPVLNAQVFFQRTLPLLQGLNLTSEGAIPSAVLTSSLDRQTMMIQQIGFANSLALSIPASQQGITSQVVPVPTPSAFLQWDPTGTFLTNGSITPGSGAMGPATTTPNSVALWNSTNGTLLQNGPGLGTAGQVLTSNGGSAAPTFQAASVGTNVPSKSILMFFTNGGANTIPSGYVVCDGTNGTPNLIGMIPMGAQFTPGAQSPNASGYGDNAKETIVGATTHTHSITSLSGSGSGTTGTPSSGAGFANGAFSAASLSHTHSFSVVVSSSGTTGTQSTNAPACYAICFIMKT